MLIDAEDWPESNWQAGGKDIHMVLMPFAPEILAVDGVGSRELLSLKCRDEMGPSKPLMGPPQALCSRDECQESFPEPPVEPSEAVGRLNGEVYFSRQF